MRETLIRVFNTVEQQAANMTLQELQEHAAWPEDCLFALVAAAPPDANARPEALDVRPVTVTTIFRTTDEQEWIKSRKSSETGARGGEATHP